MKKKDYDKAIFEISSAIASSKCVFCKNALHICKEGRIILSPDVISVEYLGRGHNVHQACWTAYLVTAKLKGEQPKKFL